MKNFFQIFSLRTSELAGTPWAFLAAVTIVVTWALAGKAMQYSEGWMLIINTLTTIVTFLMVFIIQSAQNRDAKIARIERQSILQSIPDASNVLLKLEEDSEERIDEISDELRQCRSEADEV